jgi:hypothetical protein
LPAVKRGLQSLALLKNGIPPFFSLEFLRSKNSKINDSRHPCRPSAVKQNRIFNAAGRIGNKTRSSAYYSLPELFRNLSF